MPHENVVSTLKDGNVVLYIRDDTKKPTIHYRLRLPGIVGYERRTTGHTNLREAERIATDRYDQLRYEKIKGRGVLPKSFRQVAALYADWLDEGEKDGRIKEKKARTDKQFLNHTLILYFGD